MVRKREKPVSEDAIVAPSAGAMSSAGVLGVKIGDDGCMADGNFLLPVKTSKSTMRRDLLPKRKKSPLVGRVHLAEDGDSFKLIGKLLHREVLAAIRVCCPEAGRVEAIAWCPASGKLLAKASRADSKVFIELSAHGGKLSCSPKSEAVDAETAKRLANCRNVQIIWRS